MSTRAWNALSLRDKKQKDWTDWRHDCAPVERGGHGSLGLGTNDAYNGSDFLVYRYEKGPWGFALFVCHHLSGIVMECTNEGAQVVYDATLACNVWL
ncbi:hypothetical protein Slin14017_G036960 [Septoria linicola]|nr:hypothetical protein Slin14017_G036960 [Septoria linicola]